MLHLALSQVDVPDHRLGIAVFGKARFEMLALRRNYRLNGRSIPLAEGALVILGLHQVVLRHLGRLELQEYRVLVAVSLGVREEPTDVLAAFECAKFRLLGALPRPCQAAVLLIVEEESVLRLV